MKKQVYLQPTMTVVKVQQRSHLMQTSSLTVTHIESGDTDITGGTSGSSDAARVKDYSVWSDDWSE